LAGGVTNTVVAFRSRTNRCCEGRASARAVDPCGGPRVYKGSGPPLQYCADGGLELVSAKRAFAFRTIKYCNRILGPSRVPKFGYATWVPSPSASAAAFWTARRPRVRHQPNARSPCRRTHTAHAMLIRAAVVPCRADPPHAFEHFDPCACVRGARCAAFCRQCLPPAHAVACGRELHRPPHRRRRSTAIPRVRMRATPEPAATPAESEALLARFRTRRPRAPRQMMVPHAKAPTGPRATTAPTTARTRHPTCRTGHMCRRSRDPRRIASSALCRSSASSNVPPPT
jgi:hypothetical protein